LIIEPLLQQSKEVVAKRQAERKAKLAAVKSQKYVAAPNIEEEEENHSPHCYAHRPLETNSAQSALCLSPMPYDCEFYGPVILITSALASPPQVGCHSPSF
jgi:hypothetical protein